MSGRERTILQISMAAVLLASMLILSRETAEYAATLGGKVVTEEKTVVIDPGHGGVDPGKIGINRAYEKDINLQIAEKVRRLLEQEDITVIMTREKDTGMYQETDGNKKVQDMKNRVAFIDNSGAKLCVSIHQNSYPQETISGAQIFYYETSQNGKILAELLQEQLIQTLQPEKERTAKANDSYYLLKKTQTPIVICECGFLSNAREAELLTEDGYQEKVAWAIHLGIMRYLVTVQ